MSIIGVKIPNAGRLASEPGLAVLASAAEAAGASSLHLSDHVVLVDGATSPYPFAADGRFPWPVDSDWYDAMASCAWVLAATERVTVGPSVLVLPQRDPLEVAKTAATLDRLSGGRLFLGVGAGWLQEEFAALGRDFATRGPRLEEAIDVLRLAWSGSGEPYEGRLLTVPRGVHCHPTPLRSSGVPVHVGGMSRAALRRAAERGDGWVALHDLSVPDTSGLLDLLRLLEGRLEASGRARGEFHAVVRFVGGSGDQAGELPAMAAFLAGAGFDEVVIDPGWHDRERAQELIAACCAQLEPLPPR